MPARAAWWGLASAAVVLGVIAVASACGGAEHLVGAHHDETDIRSAARAFVEAYGNVDAAASGGYRGQLLDRSSGELHAALEQSALDGGAIATHRSVDTAVDAVSVTASARAAAVAVVSATQQRHWLTQTGTSISQRLRLQLALHLVQVGGRWLVDGIEVQDEQLLAKASGS